MVNYLLRLDDACPTMSIAKWQKIENILDNYGICPLVGVIPNNEDSNLLIDHFDSLFWEKVRRWQRKKWGIAMHGYNHFYSSNKGLNGLNPLWERSEFAGVSLGKQKEKIREGVKIFRAHGIDPHYFFAPSHTFDNNTLIALKEESNIRIISDTIATKPYRKDGFVFIPQLGGHCTEIKLPGIWTFCLHPSAMSDENIVATEHFLKKHHQEFIGFDELDLKKLKEKDLFSKLLNLAYFTRRKIRGIK